MAANLENYLVQIQDATQITGIYAYRGQQDSQWPLHSAATRRLINEHGSDVVRDQDFPELYVDYHRETLVEPARTRGFGFQSGRQSSDVQLLARLQHFGAATGLLDFTWSPLVALWFASEDRTRDGKLFVVNTNDAIRVARVPSDEAAQNLTAVLSDAAVPPHLSYWEPMVSGDASARILRQRSVFIIGRPLVPIDNELIREIIVAKDDKESLRIGLETLDFHEESLFQDVYGFAQASNRRTVPPLTPQIYNRRGNRHYQNGDYDEAVAAYSKSIELAPNDPLIHLLRGNAHAASGDHQKSVEDYDKAVDHISQLQPYIRDALFFNRGNSKAELADYESALQDYSEALRINPELPHCYCNRGNTYADLYRFEEALLDYDRVTGHTSRDAASNKGNALLALGRLSEARCCYEDAVAKGADHSRSTQNQWTLDQIMLVVDGLKYTVKAAPDPVTGTMCLRFKVSERDIDAARSLERFLFVGRAGNVGNTGGPSLSGGKGFGGKPPIRVYVDVWKEDRT